MKSMLWKVYTLIFCAIQITSILENGNKLSEMVITIWSMIGIVALVGYVLKKSIGAAIIWRIYFGILAISVTMFLVFLVYAYLAKPNTEAALSIGFMLLVQIPYWYALYVYAYKSKYLWKSNA